VDTNVAIMVIDNADGRIKEQGRKNIADWYATKIKDASSVISFATVAELKRWVISRKNPADQERVARAVRDLLSKSYVIHSNEAILESWAMIRQEATVKELLQVKDTNDTQINDLWIAATAHASKLTLVTNDKWFGWMIALGLDVMTYNQEHSPIPNQSAQ